jgi:hypothetical protein|tara:strand:+ start:700 stop:1236 length:537 start_codon:yes stop_codon:yes gene_type:complete
MNIDRTGGVWWKQKDLLMNIKNHNTVRIGRHGSLVGIKLKLKNIGFDIDQYKIITLVREPVDRVLSSWKWYSLVKDTAKKHKWTSIDGMLDEFESGGDRANYLPQTRWLCEEGAKFDHIFRFEDLLKGPSEVQKVFPEYKPKGRLKASENVEVTEKQIDRIKELYKEDIEYLSSYYDN